MTTLTLNSIKNHGHIESFTDIQECATQIDGEWVFNTQDDYDWWQNLANAYEIIEMNKNEMTEDELDAVSELDFDGIIRKAEELK